MTYLDIINKFGSLATCNVRSNSRRVIMGTLGWLTALGSLCIENYFLNANTDTLYDNQYIEALRDSTITLANGETISMMDYCSYYGNDPDNSSYDLALPGNLAMISNFVGTIAIALIAFAFSKPRLSLTAPIAALEHQPQYNNNRKFTNFSTFTILSLATIALNTLFLLLSISFGNITGEYDAATCAFPTDPEYQSLQIMPELIASFIKLVAIVVGINACCQYTGTYAWGYAGGVGVPTSNRNLLPHAEIDTPDQNEEYRVRERGALYDYKPGDAGDPKPQTDFEIDLHGIEEDPDETTPLQTDHEELTDQRRGPGYGSINR